MTVLRQRVQECGLFPSFRWSCIHRIFALVLHVTNLNLGKKNSEEDCILSESDKRIVVIM